MAFLCLCISKAMVSNAIHHEFVELLFSSTFCSQRRLGPHLYAPFHSGVKVRQPAGQPLGSQLLGCWTPVNQQTQSINILPQCPHNSLPSSTSSEHEPLSILCSVSSYSFCYFYSQLYDFVMRCGKSFISFGLLHKFDSWHYTACLHFSTVISFQFICIHSCLGLILVTHSRLRLQRRCTRSLGKDFLCLWY